MGVVLFILLLGALYFLLSLFFSTHELPTALVRWLRPLGIVAILAILYVAGRREPTTLQMMLQDQYGGKTGRRVFVGMLVLFVIGALGLLALRVVSYRALSTALQEGGLE